MDDWRDEKSYEKYKDLTFREYAWEFLRRVEGYRADHDEYAHQYNDIVHKGEAYEGVQWREKHGLLQRLLGGYVDYRKSTFDLKAEGFEIPWKLNYVYPDVCIVRESYPHLHFTLRKKKRIEPLTPEEAIEDMMPIKGSLTNGVSLVAVGFDIAYPIDKQLKEAKRLLMDLREKQYGTKFPKHKPRHKRSWPNYLRILDATLDGISTHEYAKVAYINRTSNKMDTEQLRDKAKDELKAAKKVMSEYISLLKYDPKTLDDL